MNTQRIAYYLLLACLSVTLHASEPSDAVHGQIAELRRQRENTIKDAVTHANEEYATGLNRLRKLYADDPKALELIARDKEEFAKPPLAPLAPVHPVRKRPKTRTPEALAHYLIGTFWNYYGNDKFLGEAKKLEFTGPATAILNDKPIEWHALDNGRIWISGNREFTFNSLFDEFDGGWVPNDKDRNTGRLIK